MDKERTIKEIKGIIRMCAPFLHAWSNGEISYGKMADHLSEELVKHFEELSSKPIE